MTYLLYTAGILFAFGLVIFVHEAGHFIVAKRSGVKVDRFSFGLGPELVGFQWGETRYCIAWFPLGGEVRMAGEMPDPNAPEKTQPMTGREFFAQPWYRRFAIAAAGPVMNYLLAILMFTGMFLYYGEPVQTNKTEIGEVMAGLPADRAGIRTGDRVMAMNGETVEDFLSLATRIHGMAGETIRLELERQGERRTVEVVPEEDPERGVGLIGIRPAEPELDRVDVGPLEAAGKATLQCWNISAFTVGYLGQKLIAREAPDVAGPLGIGQVIVKAVKSGWEDFLGLIAMISVAIGLFNLFPIPLLDGGHLLYYAIEGARGRPVGQKTMARANMVGLALLLSLLVFATMNDVRRMRMEPPAAPAAE